jgi:hypothetical protein
MSVHLFQENISLHLTSSIEEFWFAGAIQTAQVNPDKVSYTEMARRRRIRLPEET